MKHGVKGAMKDHLTDALPPEGSRSAEDHDRHSDVPPSEDVFSGSNYKDCVDRFDIAGEKASLPETEVHVMESVPEKKRKLSTFPNSYPVTN